MKRGKIQRGADQSKRKSIQPSGEGCDREGCNGEQATEKYAMESNAKGSDNAMAITSNICPVESACLGFQKVALKTPINDSMR